jgi:two-component system sensor kinase FixL
MIARNVGTTKPGGRYTRALTGARAASMHEGSSKTANFPSFPELEALLRLQGRLLHVSRLATVGEMSSGIAHELNQPLCAMANYAQACERLLALPDPDITEIRESLQEITSQALRAGEVIRRLRSLARPQQARPDLTDINPVLAELTDLIQSDAKVHHVRYRFEPGAGLPQVRADRAQIQQLVLNLVHNAIEALAEVPPESREVTIRTSRTDNGDVEVCVSDRGPGVSPAIAPHLFTPFCTTKSAGTGLGLAMSRTIAEANSGTLGYRPNWPTGSCFTLLLPAAQAASAHSPPEAFR